MKDVTFQKKIQAAYKRNVIVVDKKNITSNSNKEPAKKQTSTTAS